MDENDVGRKRVKALLRNHGLLDVLTHLVDETGLELLEYLPTLCEEMGDTFSITGDRDSALIWKRAAKAIERACREVFSFPFPCHKGK